jgi:hypothetical protein
MIDEEQENNYTYKEIDEDTLYETMVLDSWEWLEQELNNLEKTFTENKEGLKYYHERPDKFWKHVKEKADEELTKLKLENFNEVGL